MAYLKTTLSDTIQKSANAEGFWFVLLISGIIEHQIGAWGVIWQHPIVPVHLLMATD
jgi:hypothetical protein